MERTPPTVATPIDELEARLDRLRQRIRALELAVDCARILANREHRLSNIGWLLSIVFDAAGTLIAVTRSEREEEYADEVHSLEMELVKLWIDKKLLLQELDEAERAYALAAERSKPALPGRPSLGKPRP